MTPPTYAEAASRLLLAGAGGDAAAGPRVCQALVEFLSGFVGASGARALFRRSLVLARRERPWLAEPAPPGDEGPWERLGASLEAHGPAAAEASVALVSTLIRLFATFVGTDLALQILHQHRPEAFPLDAPRESA